jgi:hypothetical protein
LIAFLVRKILLQFFDRPKRHLNGTALSRAATLGAGLIEPQGRECLLHPEFLAWHRAEVFKEPARE